MFLAILIFIIGLFGSCNVEQLTISGMDLSSIFSMFIGQKNAVLDAGNRINSQLLYAIHSTVFSGKEGYYGGSAAISNRLVTCFLTGDGRGARTDSTEIFDAVEVEFNLAINSHMRQQILILAKMMPMDGLSDRSILTHNLSKADGKTNIGLCNFAYNALNTKSGYVYGAYGQDITMSYLVQQQRIFSGDSDANLTDSEVNFIYETFGGQPAFDCIGLIKAYEWLDEDTGNIQYCSNGFKDVGATGMRNSAVIYGDISTIPDIPGLAVCMDGHIGIYLGNGEVIEAQGNRTGVVITQLKGRGWTSWMQLPGITYVTSGTYQIDRWSVHISDGRAVEWTENTVSGKGDFAWPLPSQYGKNCITSGSGSRYNPVTGTWENSHGAIDIGAPAGTPVYAAADGVVIYATWDNSYGNFVKIKHNETYSTLYAHNSQLKVKNGQYVKQGDVISLVGSTGDSTGNHLHFEIRENENRLDPTQFY